MKNKKTVEIPQKDNIKIAIIGHSGSGKSTLAAFLGERFLVPVLHIDTIHFLPGWVEREKEDERAIMRAFLDENEDRGWVIDGNYMKLEHERRMEESDILIYMNFPRIACFFRALRRSRKYRNESRPSIAPGCNEKFDRSFRWWILKRGRTKEKLARYDAIVEKYREKSIVIKNQLQLNKFVKKIKEGKCTSYYPDR